MKHRISILAALFVLASGTVHAQYSETNNLFYFAQRTPKATNSTRLSSRQPSICSCRASTACSWACRCPSAT